jgi:hypothetical protein
MKVRFTIEEIRNEVKKFSIDFDLKRLPLKKELIFLPVEKQYDEKSYMFFFIFDKKKQFKFKVKELKTAIYYNEYRGTHDPEYYDVYEVILKPSF